METRRRYVTPLQLRRELESRLRVAGIRNPVCTKARYYTTEDGKECLKTSVFEYATTKMPLETLQEYERVLKAMPGVVETRIVNDGKGGLRDQVSVIHLRMWDEPEG